MMDEYFEKRCRLQVKRAFDATIDGGESHIEEHAGAECTGLNFVKTFGLVIAVDHRRLQAFVAETVRTPNSKPRVRDDSIRD
jgi:hypothetical protein